MELPRVRHDLQPDEAVEQLGWIAVKLELLEHRGVQAEWWPEQRLDPAVRAIELAIGELMRCAR